MYKMFENGVYQRFFKESNKMNVNDPKAKEIYNKMNSKTQKFATAQVNGKKDEYSSLKEYSPAIYDDLIDANNTFGSDLSDKELEQVEKYILHVFDL